MSYYYDIFISYRRDPETLTWINEHFVPILTQRLDFELGRKPKFYIDQQMEVGSSWPPALGAALGTSRVLIALWTGNYLESVWCTHEFAQMLSREKEAKLRTVTKPLGLVIPAFIHDGESFPVAIKHIQPLEIQPTFNSRMSRTSVRAEQLADALAQHAPAIAASIKGAPAWRKNWATKAAATFYKLFHQHALSEQKSVPRFTRRDPARSKPQPRRNK